MSGKQSLIDQQARQLEALRYMADAENWQGDPTSTDAVLFGHDTPYELSRNALDEGNTDRRRDGGRPA